MTNPFSEESEMFARECDAATISKDIERLKNLVDQALKGIENHDAASQANIYYSIGTIHADIAFLTGNMNDELSRKKQLYYFRKSIEIIEREEFSNSEYRPYVLALKFNLYTNYANALEHLGRKIEAIEQYKKVLAINPNFGMASGNLGVAYQHYGMLVSDPWHRDLLHNCAYTLLSKAIASEDKYIYEKARERFRLLRGNYDFEYVEKVLSVDPAFSQFEYDDADELEYRKWALRNGLFLNPLNDLPYSEIAFAADVLQLPSMTVKIDAKPIFHGMFNQLKQEYVFARYQYYLGIQATDKPHFADKDTYLLQFPDYPLYSIRIEQLKSSFRILFSLLDKAAFFINAYYDLGIKERDVSFSAIWKSEKPKNYKYKNVLDPTANFALASLYWISKDFYEAFVDSPNPQAKRVSDIRHALEHRYSKVYWDIFPERANGEIDDLAIYISEEELIEETFRLLKLIREVIICLALAVGIEERKRNASASPNTVVPQISFLNYDDEWKL